VPTSRLTVVGVGRQGGRKPLINSAILRRAARLYRRELHRRPDARQHLSRRFASAVKVRRLEPGRVSNLR